MSNDEKLGKGLKVLQDLKTSLSDEAPLDQEPVRTPLWKSTFVVVLRWVFFFPVYIIATYLIWLVLLYAVEWIIFLSLPWFLVALFVGGGVMVTVFSYVVLVPLIFLVKLCPNVYAGAITLGLVMLYLIGDLTYTVWQVLGTGLEWEVFRLIIVTGLLLSSAGMTVFGLFMGIDEAEK